MICSDYFDGKFEHAPGVIYYHSPILLKDIKALKRGTKLEYVIINLYEETITIKDDVNKYTFKIKGVIET